MFCIFRSYAASNCVFPEQSDDRFGEQPCMIVNRRGANLGCYVPRKLASSIRGTRPSKLTPSASLGRVIFSSSSSSSSPLSNSKIGPRRSPKACMKHSGTRRSKLTPAGISAPPPGSRGEHGRLGGEARRGQREAPRVSRSPDRRDTRTASARTQSARSLHRRARQRGKRAGRIQAHARHPPWLGAPRRRERASEISDGLGNSFAEKTFEVVH